MNLCIHRTEQQELRGVSHFCLAERRECGGIRQLGCTLRDLGPGALFFAAVVGGILWAVFA
jgi:hypothetical protein